MPLPGGITTIVLTGTYLSPAGDPVLVREGRPAQVTFTPNTVITDNGGKVIFTTRPIVALLNAAGQFGITLACTDNTGLNPHGWVWDVNEQIPELGREYSILLPSTLGETVDISDLSPVASVPPASSYILTSQVGEPSGVAELDSSGLIPEGELPDLSGTYLSLAGGTMAGPIGLPGNPTAALQAAPKQYVDAETTRAESAESANASAITAETSRAEAAEALKAPLASPALTGSPTAPTASPLSDSTQVATTAYADGAVSAEKTRAEAAEALLAPLVSPALSGTPTAPTKTALTDSTAIATTAYADAAVAVETSRAETAEAAIPTTGTPLAVNRGGTGSGTQNWTGLLTPTTQAGTYTATAGELVKANIASSSWTMKLPNAPANNTIVGAKVIVNATGNANTLTVACQGSDVFEQSGGATSTTLSLLSQAAAWQYNSGYWTRVSDDLPLSQLSNLYQPVFSVRAYGAKSDGATDDTSAVAAAYAAAGGAGTVVFPPGTVTCIQGNINPAGAATWGPGATVRFLAGITPAYAMFTPTAACSFYGLTFDLNKASTTSPGSNTDGAAIHVYNASGWAGVVAVTSCTIINGWECGLLFQGGSATSALSLPTSPFLVSGCTITGCGNIGVYAYSTADGAVVNSYIQSNGASGIEEVTGLRNRFSGNTCVSNGADGIVSLYSYGTLITGNDCTDNGTSGIAIGGGSTTISPATHFTITGNTCRNNGHTSPGHGIDVDTTITGEGTTPVPAYGTIAGNTCDSNVDHGIYVNNAQYVAVTGNVSNGNGDYGIELTCENASVSGNICTGNLGGIVIASGGGHMIGLNYTAGNTDYGYSDAGSVASTYAAGGTQSPGGTADYLRADGTWDSPSSAPGALLASHQYAPATLAGYASTSTTLAAVDTTHMTVSFTAPADGNVIVSLTAFAATATESCNEVWGLLDHTSGDLYGNQMVVADNTAPGVYTARQLITGLTGSAAYQMDWALATTVASDSVALYAMGAASKTAAPSQAGPALMEVWAA